MKTFSASEAFSRKGMAAAVAAVMLAANLVPAAASAAISVGVGANAGSGSGASMSGSVQAQAGAKEDSSRDDRNDSEMTGSTSSAKMEDGSAQDDSNDSMTASAGGSMMLNLTRGDVSADSSGEASVTAPSSVQSSSDLDLFARGLVRGDAGIKAVSSNEDSVSVDYKAPAKFLGLFPSSLSSRAMVNADGTVEVSHPWYAFFFSSGDDSALKADLQSAAKADVSAGAKLSAREQAALLAQIHSAMRARFGASASADANASAGN